jgi:hypothetical protein
MNSTARAAWSCPCWLPALRGAALVRSAEFENSATSLECDGCRWNVVCSCLLLALQSGVALAGCLRCVELLSVVACTARRGCSCLLLALRGGAALAGCTCPGKQETKIQGVMPGDVPAGVYRCWLLGLRGAALAGCLRCMELLLLVVCAALLLVACAAWSCSCWLLALRGAALAGCLRCVELLLPVACAAWNCSCRLLALQSGAFHLGRV